MQQRLKLGILAYVHFLADFACALWVNYVIIRNAQMHGRMICFGDSYDLLNYVIYDDKGIYGYLLYNFCALFLVLPLGMILDRLHQNQKKAWWIAAAGCVLIGMAGLLAFLRLLRGAGGFYYSMTEMLCILICLGFGNALFHAGAGVRVLQMGERMTPLGVFTSPGAFGTCLGTICVVSWGLNIWQEAVLMVFPFLAAVVLLLGWKMDLPEMLVRKNGQIKFRSMVILLLLFLLVVLQSFLESYIQFSWNNRVLTVLLLALCIVAGRILGGILADRFALSLMHKQMAGRLGTVFGLCSVAWFAGWLPKFLYRYSFVNGFMMTGSEDSHFLAKFSLAVVKWWPQHRKVSVYCGIAGICFLLLMVLLLKRGEQHEEMET